ncbi:hypothetical protein BDY21DRAFT_97180 [Lineolata rhizophorae]|uniref:Uncharacterized protein n=1 Tax=Lineolata rhizophorae TaxID=578093 RepID=A0A6A6NT34_9PEZI|nr:hypothetical protein BDY21DRAFT_97180 [Lineolata rhizophorae]
MWWCCRCSGHAPGGRSSLQTPAETGANSTGRSQRTLTGIVGNKCWAALAVSAPLYPANGWRWVPRVVVRVLFLTGHPGALFGLYLQNQGSLPLLWHCRRDVAARRRAAQLMFPGRGMRLLQRDGVRTAAGRDLLLDRCGASESSAGRGQLPNLTSVCQRREPASCPGIHRSQATRCLIGRHLTQFLPSLTGRSCVFALWRLARAVCSVRCRHRDGQVNSGRRCPVGLEGVLPLGVNLR